MVNFKLLVCRELPALLLLCFIYTFGQSFLVSDKIIVMKDRTHGTSYGLKFPYHRQKNTEDKKLNQKELQELGDIVQKRLHYIQNPSSCQSRRKLQCNLHGCGLGCQVNSVTMCLMLAYALNRTVVVRPEMSHWLQPISLTCTDSRETNRSVFNEDHEKYKVIERDFSNKYKPNFFPPALPDDLKEKITRYHDNPELWWTGQISSYVFRPTNKTNKLLSVEETKIGFTNPIVGVHIRRTDKLFKEAKFHSVDEYMKHVVQWYDNLEETTPVVQRRIFLATDDPSVTREIKQRYPDYELVNNANFTSMASSVDTRRSEQGLFGIVHDIHLLAKCDFLVCTYTSNVCRLAVQLLTSSRGNVTSYAVSLDRADWSFAGPKHTRDVIGVPMPLYN